MLKKFNGGVILLVSNFLLIVILGCVIHKTDFRYKVMKKYGVFKLNETDFPDYWAVFSWTNTLQKLNYKADIVFFGNSITRGSNFHEYFPEKKIVNLGYSGDDLSGMLRRVNQISAVNPDIIFLMAGINGLKEMSDDNFKYSYTLLVDSIQRANPSAELFIQSILPINSSVYERYGNNSLIEHANEMINDIALEKGCQYIDLFTIYCIDGELPDFMTNDGIHLYKDAYGLWGQTIAPIILQ